MDRSKFPEGVEVSQVALEHAQDATQYHLQQRFVDSTRHGRVEGLELSVNGTSFTRFDVSPGRGYTPRGDLVESEGVTAAALTDYENGVLNYVCLFYREVPDVYQTHELDGLTRPTILRRSSELRIISSTAYEELPDSHSIDLEENLLDADLARDAKDRLIVIAIIKGKGFSGGTPNGYNNVTDRVDNGSGANIQQQPYFIRALSATFGAKVDPGKNYSLDDWMNIKSISQTTHVGQGILRLDGSLDSLFWYPPTADGTPSATASSAVVTSPSPKGTPVTVSVTHEGSTIEVEIYQWLLPTGAGGGYPYSNYVDVSDIHADPGQVFTGEDILHRAKQGSYSPSQNNPHGLGLPDIIQHIARILGPLVLGDGELSSNEKRLIPRITTPKGAGTGVYTLLWEVPGTVSSTRIYAVSDGGAGGGQLIFTQNARWVTDEGWTRDAGVGSSASQLSLGVANFTYGTYGGVSEYFLFQEAVASDPLKAGAPFGLQLGSGWLNTLAERRQPRIKVDRDTDGSPFYRVLLFESAGDSNALGGTYRVYLTSALEITFNARYNDGWFRDINGATSARIRINSVGGILLQIHEAAQADSWGEEGWNTTLLSLDSATLKLIPREIMSERTVEACSALGGLGGGTVAAFKRTFTANTTVDPDKRWLLLEANNAEANGISIRLYYVRLPTDYALEIALNARWEGYHWQADNNNAGSAQLYRLATNGFTRFRRGNLNVPWGDAQWDNTPFGSLEVVRVDQVICGGQIDASNIVATTSVQAPVYRGGNAPRAYGRFLTGGGVTWYGRWQVNHGSLNYGPMNRGIQLLFTDPIPNPVITLSLFPAVAYAEMLAGSGSQVTLSDVHAKRAFRAQWFTREVSSLGFVLYIMYPHLITTDPSYTLSSALNTSKEDQYEVTFTVFSGV